MHLAHRESVDFDFFSDQPIRLSELLDTNPLMKDARVLQNTPDTLTVLVDRDGPVMLSFFVVPGVLNPTSPPLLAPENGIKVAALRDLAAMKVKVVCDRAEKKDYVDVDAILRLTDVTLAEALAAARAVYGKKFEPLLSIKALSYFGDGNLPDVPEDVRQRIRKAVRGVDPLRLPDIERG